MSTLTFYDEEFYANQWQESLNSAREVVPLICKMYNPKTVIDIGGGVGTWCKAFEENKVKAFCIDGEYVIPEMRLTENFVSANIEMELPLPKINLFKPDLVVCLEVAEHLPAKRAESFVKELTEIAPIIVFSAAIPGQGGTNHINEQPHAYWHELFSQNGFKKEEVLRLAVNGLNSVQWWYRQNIFTYKKQ